MANVVNIKVTADAKQAKEEMDSLDGRMKGLGTAGKVGAVALLGGVTALAGGLGASIKVAADFEHAIDQVGAVAQATEAEMKLLADTALRIGKDTAFSATEAAAAMGELAAMGVSTTDILGGAADAVVALAAASGADMVTAATAASSAMNIWKLGTKDMTEVVNRLTGAANVSAFGLEDMVQGLASGGIAASTFKISMEDTTTALAALSKGGFQAGSDAGTSFKAMLTGLAAPTGAGAKAIARLGIDVRDATGNMKPMAGIIDELNAKLGALSAADRDKAMSEIFGSDGMRAAAALMKMTGQEFEAMSATMENTDAAAVAAVRMGNFKGSLEQLKGSIETIMIEVGGRFLPALTSLAALAAEKLPVAFAAAEAKVAEWKPTFEKIGHVITDDIIPKLQEFADFAGEKFKEFQGYYETDIKPAVDNIVAAIKYVVDWTVEHWPEIERVVRPVIEQVMATIEAMKDVIVNVLQIIIDLLAGDWAGAWSNVKELIGGVRDYVVETLGNLKDALAGAISGIFTLTKYIGSAILNGIKEGIADAWDAFTGWLWEQLKKLPDIIKKFFKIGSPSRLMAEEVGKPLAEGIGVGFREAWTTHVVPGIARSMSDLLASITRTHATPIGGSRGTFGSGPGGTFRGSGGSPGSPTRPGGFNVDTDLMGTWNGATAASMGMTPLQWLQFQVFEAGRLNNIESPWGSIPQQYPGGGGGGKQPYHIQIIAPMGDGASIRRMVPTMNRELARHMRTNRGR